MEHQNVEYQIVWRDEYLKWICRFANALGILSATFQRKTSDVSLEKNVAKSVEKILMALSRNLYLTQSKLCEITGLSRRGVEKNLLKLRQIGFLRRIGPDRGGRWEVVEHTKTGDVG